MDKNSMLYWYPKIKVLGIPMPETEIIEVEFDFGNFCDFIDGQTSVLKQYFQEIHDKANVIGYPLFMRSDQRSAKHKWKYSCYVKSEKDIINNLRRIFEASLMADIIGLAVNAIVLREFIPLDAPFTAFFGEMPVARERRYFIRDGEVVCHHPYWIEDSILNPSIPNWREVLAELNTETAKELITLSNLAHKVADQFDGYWSVDFAQGKDERWYLIDMALGANSWHPKCDKTMRVKN